MLRVHRPCNKIWIQQRRGFRLARHQHRGHGGEVAVFRFSFSSFLFLAVFAVAVAVFRFFFSFSTFLFLAGAMFWEEGGRSSAACGRGAGTENYRQVEIFFLNLMFELINDQGNPQPCLDERGASVPIQVGEVGDGGHLGHRQELGLARPPPGHLEPP